MLNEETAAVERKAAAERIIYWVETGQIDNYLKAVVDAVVLRKARLELDGDLPTQQHCEGDDTATVVTFAQEGESEVAEPAEAKKPKRIVRPKRQTHFYARSERPDPNHPVYQGKFHSLPEGQTADHIINLFGRYYDKKEMMGKVIDISHLFGGDPVFVQIIGIGPNAVKVLLAREPQVHHRYGKSSLHLAWENNEPVFFKHNAISPYLD